MGRGGERRELGVVGLGRMGGGLALQAAEKGIRVVGHDPAGLRPELAQAGVHAIDQLQGFREELAPPRAVLLYVPAGAAVDLLLEGLAGQLERGDVVVDGGNSYWRDSVRRQRHLAARGLGFVDLGTSGGVEGARHGACLMAGGERQDVEVVEPLLRELAVAGGYLHVGQPGSGHFAKLVHNGIEFGMLEAIGEGVDLLERHPGELDIGAILSCWCHGSVIRSWLMDLMHAAYVDEGGLERIPPFVEDTGEVNWLVADALQLEAPVPVIAEAVMQLFTSRDARRSWARAVAMMRHSFGGHPYGPNAAVAAERRRGRMKGVGDE